MNRLKVIGAIAGSALFAAGCGPLAVPGAPSTGSQAQALSVPAATAQTGEIQQTLSYSGDVRAKEQITVLPKASGRVQRVLVDVGSPVHAGDLLAELEQDSPEIQVLQARANLAAAQAKLATIQAGAKPDDVAAAEEAVGQQQARLAAMQAQGRAEDVAAAQAGVAAQSARLNLMLSGGGARGRGPGPAPRGPAPQKRALPQK